MQKANREAEPAVFATADGEKKCWYIGAEEGREFFETEDGGTISFVFGDPGKDFRYTPPGIPEPETAEEPKKKKK